MGAIGGAIGGIAVMGGIAAYWYFYMRKAVPAPMSKQEDSIPRTATMNNPMMSTPGSRDSIPLFVAQPQLGLGLDPAAAAANAAKRQSTWDNPSQADSYGQARLDPAYEVSSNPVQQGGRLSQALGSGSQFIVNQQALYSSGNRAGQPSAHPTQDEL